MITSFQGPYRFLSNFYPAEVWLDGLKYPTSEHAYQAAKTDSLIERLRIKAAPTPGKAKALGKLITVRDDWELDKVACMWEILVSKFQDPALAKLLLDTGDQEIVEGNTWGDTFWGVYNGEGHNKLGNLLMSLRADLRDHGSTKV